MTVHLMRDIDLFSAFANFEVDYTNSIFKIKNFQEKVIISKDQIFKKFKGALTGPSFIFYLSLIYNSIVILNFYYVNKFSEYFKFFALYSLH